MEAVERTVTGREQKRKKSSGRKGKNRTKGTKETKSRSLKTATENVTWNTSLPELKLGVGTEAKTESEFMQTPGAAGDLGQRGDQPQKAGRHGGPRPSASSRGAWLLCGALLDFMPPVLPRGPRSRESCCWSLESQLPSEARVTPVT